MWEWIKKLKHRRRIKPAEHAHRDGFVYRVILTYELPSNTNGKPVIRVKDDGAILGDKLMLPHEQDGLMIQFGGEPNCPPVFAQIQVSDVEDCRKP